MATAGTAVADAGAATSSGQVSPPAAESSVAPAPERPFHYGKAQMVPPPPRAEEAPEPTPTADAEETTTPDQEDAESVGELDLEGDTPEGENEQDGEPEQPVPDVAQWAATLRDAPTRINEIPAKQRAQAIQQMLATERETYERAATIAYERGVAAAQEQAQIERAVAEIDDLRASDAAAFVDWEDANPEKAAAYRAIKAKQAAPASSQQAEATYISQQTASLLADLRAVPGAHDALLAMGKQYPATPQGVIALARDTETAIATAKRQASDPDSRKAAARQANAENIKGIPKPAGTGSVGAPGQLTAEALTKMSQAEVAALYDKPGGAEQIQRAMAEHAKKFA